MDGSVPVMERSKLCDNFNRSPSYFCMLLTVQISGVGLNLIGADRVIILDPDWNPANDSQAIDRAHRIGQKKDVFVYRFITTNTVEEAVYRRQVFKAGLGKATIEAQELQTYKYFSDNELKDILLRKSDDINHCEALNIINEIHPFDYEKTTTNKVHIPFL